MVVDVCRLEFMCLVAYHVIENMADVCESDIKCVVISQYQGKFLFCIYPSDVATLRTLVEEKGRQVLGGLLLLN